MIIFIIEASDYIHNWLLNGKQSEARLFINDKEKQQILILNRIKGANVFFIDKLIN